MSSTKPKSKICSKCKSLKAIKDFRERTNSAGSKVPLAACKTCEKEYRARVKNPDYLNSYRDTKKKEDPLFYKSHQLRSNWATRAKKLKVDNPELPSAKEIRDWLNSQKPYTCYYTGESVTEKHLGLDHLTPIARGGVYNLSNIVVTSQYINGAKGEMTEQEFRELLELVSSWEDKGKSLLKRLRFSGGMYTKGKRG